MESLGRKLGKMLMSKRITITVYTVGGVDLDGNEVDEPVVFDGHYSDACNFLTDEDNLNRIQKIMEDLDDGYIEVEVGDYSREVYDAWEIRDVIEEMI